MPRLRDLTAVFLRIANTTVGGGDPTVAALQRELSRRGWLPPDHFAIAFGLSRLTPGTNMIAFCAAAGWYTLGYSGALAAVLAATIPSSVLVIWLTGICEMGNRIPWLQAAVNGAIAAALGTMLASVLWLIRGQVTASNWARPAIILIGAFLLRQAGLSPLMTIGAAALFGLVWQGRR